MHQTVCSRQIKDEIKAQSIGPKFSVHADEFTEMSNKQQMGQYQDM